ncbi:MAG: hypothetical protein GXC73_17010 [Chitinophagaceae bacterium]|nr:hypothetical protein [Chitinophagaceae bacterium]
MHLHPSSTKTKLRSSVFLLIIVGNLLFSAIFVMSMGVQVVKTGTTLPETAEKAPPAEEQKLVTLAQIN